MSTRVDIEHMASAITDALEEYRELAVADVKDAIKATGKAVKKEVERTAPKDTGAYAKSWTVKTTSENNASLTQTVYSKTKYQLTHLLEYGHAKRGGGRVAARPHLADAEEKGGQFLEEELQRRLK